MAVEMEVGHVVKFGDRAGVRVLVWEFCFIGDEESWGEVQWEESVSDEVSHFGSGLAMMVSDGIGFSFIDGLKHGCDGSPCESWLLEGLCGIHFWRGIFYI